MHTAEDLAGFVEHACEPVPQVRQLLQQLLPHGGNGVLDAARVNAITQGVKPIPVSGAQGAQWPKVSVAPMPRSRGLCSRAWCPQNSSSPPLRSSARTFAGALQRSQQS